MISKHISMREGTYSVTATRLGLENKPTEEHLNNMKLLAVKVFEPLREWVGGPIRINSFYRGPELNKAIGGSNKSQHCHGQAVDIDDVYGHKTNAEMFNYIKDNLEFDLAAEDLRLSIRHLGTIVGKVDVEEILGSIFENFCIGK